MKVFIFHCKFLQKSSVVDKYLNNKVFWMNSPVYATVFFQTFQNLIIKLMYREAMKNEMETIHECTAWNSPYQASSTYFSCFYAQC